MCPDTAGIGCPNDLLNTVSTCGTCTTSCNATVNNVLSPLCEDGMCTYDECLPDYLDCDNRTNNGCEVLSTNDVRHCGACGVDCAVAGTELGHFVSSTCINSTCSLLCLQGWRDCDGDFRNGCEVDLSHPETCGTCNNDCTAKFVHVDNVTCEAGACIPTCAANFSQCAPDDVTLPEVDCTVDLLTNASHCGSCDVDCSELPHVDASKVQCVNGVCSISDACEAGFLDCDGLVSNGCEQDASLCAFGEVPGVCSRAKARYDFDCNSLKMADASLNLVSDSTCDGASGLCTLICKEVHLFILFL